MRSNAGVSEELSEAVLVERLHLVVVEEEPLAVDFHRDDVVAMIEPPATSSSVSTTCYEPT